MTQETKILTGIGIITIAIVTAGAFFLGGSSSSEKPKPPVEASILIRPDSHRISSSNSKITLVEFGDFQCPACSASHPIIKQLLSDYKNELTFVFRNYPLPMHKNAKIAELAAEAAGAQGKFFEMENLLFENQKDWSESNKALTDHFMKYAKELELDIDKFEKDVKDKKYESKITRDKADGDSLGVNSTPTFFINGVIQPGGLPYDQFKAKIDEVLKSK